MKQQYPETFGEILLICKKAEEGTEKMLGKENWLVLQPRVNIQGFEYLVDFGLGNHPLLIHRVSKNKKCSCGNPNCPAIDAVRMYLQAGGRRAPDPEELPPCPICSAKTYWDPAWDGKYTRQPGWRCENGGLQHFLEAKANRIKAQLKIHPWLIQPTADYAGVLREEIMTWEECDRIKRNLHSEEHYKNTREAINTIE